MALSQEEVMNTKTKKENISTESDNRANDYLAENALKENTDGTKDSRSERKKEASKTLYLNRYE